MKFRWLKEPALPYPPSQMTADQLKKFEAAFLEKCRVLDESAWLTDEEKVALSNDARESLLKNYSEFMRL